MCEPYPVRNIAIFAREAIIKDIIDLWGNDVTVYDFVEDSENFAQALREGSDFFLLQTYIEMLNMNAKDFAEPIAWDTIWDEVEKQHNKTK